MKNIEKSEGVTVTPISYYGLGEESFDKEVDSVDMVLESDVFKKTDNFVQFSRVQEIVRKVCPLKRVDKEFNCRVRGAVKSYYAFKKFCPKKKITSKMIFTSRRVLRCRDKLCQIYVRKMKGIDGEEFTVIEEKIDRNTCNFAQNGFAYEAVISGTIPKTKKEFRSKVAPYRLMKLEYNDYTFIYSGALDVMFLNEDDTFASIEVSTLFPKEKRFLQVWLVGEQLIIHGKIDRITQTVKSTLVQVPENKIGKIKKYLTEVMKEVIKIYKKNDNLKIGVEVKDFLAVSMEIEERDPCKFFFRNGYCRYGGKCRFSHDRS